MVRQGAVAGGVSPSPAVWRGVGPGEAGPPLSPGFTSGTRARGRGTPGSGFLRAAPPGPSPTAVGSAAQGDAGTVTSPGRADAVGVVAEPVAPGSAFLPHPSCRRVWASSAGTRPAEERERRSAPGRFCKIAVTTLPRVWVGEMG